MMISLSSGKGVALAIFFILLVTLIAYSSSLKNGFVDWDDYEYVVNNPYIKEFSFHNIKTIFTSLYQGTYDPLVFLSYNVEYALFGRNPFYYHLNNLILHLANSALVFWLVSVVSGSTILATVSGAFFGIHPLHVESVAWVTERKDMLAAFFYLSALLCYISYRTKDKSGFYGFTIFFFLLSLLSKPIGLTLPFILLCYDLLILKKRFGHVLFEKIPLLLLSLVCGAVALYAQQKGGGVDIEVTFSVPEKIYIGYYSLFFYVLKTLHPLNLSALYPYPDTINFFAARSLAAFLFLLVCIFGIMMLMRKSKTVSFFALFFLLAILPAVKFIPFGNALVADRFMYLPSIGLLPCLGFGCLYPVLSGYGSRSGLSIALLGTVVIIGCFSLLTYQRCKIWHNNFSLWSDVVKKSPQSALARFGLANAFVTAGNYKTAIQEYRQAISLAPTYVDAYANLGNTLQMTGEQQEAKENLAKALALNPRKPRALLGLANIYQRAGEIEKAREYYQKAADLNPLLPEVYVGLADSYRAQGLQDKAVQAYQKAITLNPDSPLYYNALGLLYMEQSRAPDAIQQFKKAVSVDPQFAGAYNNLGLLYRQQGKHDQAIRSFKSAIDRSPELLSAYDALVQIYLKQKKNTEAIAIYKKCLAENQTSAGLQRLMNLYYKLEMEDDILKACSLIPRISPLYPESLLCLGDYYRNKGDLHTAEEKYREALKFDADDARIYFALGMTLWGKKLTAEAAKYLEKARALGLKDPGVATNLGIIYFNQEMLGKAIKEFSEALQLDNTLIVPHLYLAQIYAKYIINRQAASYHVRQILMKEPDNPKAKELRDVLLRLKEESE